VAGNKLFYGDNLDVLRKRIDNESVDLVYLDPPFNSARNYNVLFGRHKVVDGGSDAAQIQAFSDTWVWTPTTDEQYRSYVTGQLPIRVADALKAFRTLLGENDAMSYLVNMAPRLVELYRVLKPTGSLYLHCDPTMSHYLKVLLDAIFGPTNFRNEIVWKRTSSHNDSLRYASVQDYVLYYGKSSAGTWNPQFVAPNERYIAEHYNRKDASGRAYRLDNIVRSASMGPRPNLVYEYKGHTPVWGWRMVREKLEAVDAAGRLSWSKSHTPYLVRYLDEMSGTTLSTIWDDIPPINSQAAERLGYPTQKPLALMERIITASSNPGDVVLDPFCGCGTTIDAAVRLKRRWVGIDVTFIAVDLIEKRLLHTYGDDIKKTYDVLGIPRDMGAAKSLFERSAFEFERWAVSRINAQPNEKQVGDKGIDGRADFPTDAKGGTGRILVSVKGGKTCGPQFVRDLLGTVQTNQAEMGVLISMAEPTRGVLDAVNHGGTYELPSNGQRFPKLQVITIAALLKGKRPDMPQTNLPYIPATKRTATKSTDSLF